MSWPEVRLNEICKTQYGYTASAIHKPVGPRFLRITDIVNDSIDWNNVPYCVINDNKLHKYLLKEGDIVIARTGATTGSAKLIRSDMNAVFASYLVRLQLDKTIAYPGFVGRLLESSIYRAFVERIKGGTAQPNANAKLLTLFKFRLPGLPIQKRIAEILSSYDDLIRNNQQRIGLLEESARQIYKEWFIRFRFPGHEHVKFINGVPKAWETSSIFDIWEISYGKNLPTKYITPSGVYPVHGADSIIGYYDKKNVDEALCLVTCRGNGSGNVRRTYGEAFVTNNSFVFRPKYKPELIRFHFAYFLMGSLKLQELRTGAAQPQLTFAGINHLKALIPPNRLLELYNQQVDPCFQQMECLRRQNTYLESARDLLSPKLMDGEFLA